MRHTNLFILTVIVCALALGNTQVRAAPDEGSFLFVAPHRMIIPPNEKVSVLNLSNRSKEARRYDLTLVDQVMNEQGVTQRSDTFPYSVKHMIKFVPKRFSLQPGEQQTVRIMVNRPTNLADGDYHSHLLFREVPLNVKDKAQLQTERKEAEKSVSFEIQTLFGIAVPVVIQHGKLVQDINFDNPKLSKTAEGKQQLSIDFLRSGNSEAASKLKVEYAADGKPPVQIVEPQWIRVYREVDKITKNIPLNVPEGAKGGKIIISLVKDEADDSKTIRKEIPFS